MFEVQAKSKQQKNTSKRLHSSFSHAVQKLELVAIIHSTTNTRKLPHNDGTARSQKTKVSTTCFKILFPFLWCKN